MPVTKVFNLALDIKKSVSNRAIEVVEGDNGNVIVATLTDNGEAVDLTSCKVLAVFAKADGRTVQQDTDGHGVTVSGTDNNVITIELYTSSFAPGLVECEIQVLSGTGYETLVTSAKFNFTCRRSIMNADTVQSTDEYPILVGLIDRVEAAEADLTTLNTQTTTAAAAATTAASTATTAAEAAETINEEVSAAEALRVTQEQSRASAEQGRVSAETSRGITWGNASATAETLEPGASATVSATVGESGVAFAFGIPKGAKGDPGDNSQPHASQHATGGSDPITPESIGAAGENHLHDPIPVGFSRSSTENIGAGTIPGVTSYYNGLTVRIFVTNSIDRTLNTTINLNNLGAKQVRRETGYYNGIGSSISEHPILLMNAAYTITYRDGCWYLDPAMQVAYNDLHGKPTIDSDLSLTSGNAVKNSTVTEALNGKASVSSATASLTVAGWDAAAKTQTVTVSEVTADRIVQVSPAPVSIEAYIKAEIYCTAQGAGTLTFTCKTVPTEDITMNVVVIA